MTELLILAILFAYYTLVIRLIRKVFPGSLPSLASFGLRSPIRRRFFGPGKCLELARIQPGWRVLEIGPGWGFSTQEACRQVGAEGELVGVDISERMLRRCRAKLQPEEGCLRCVASDGARLPFADCTFDAALLVSVLGQVRRRRELFSEIRRCLKPGAAAIVNELILDPDFVFPWTVKSFGRHAGLEIAETTGNILCHTTALRRPLSEGAACASSEALRAKGLATPAAAASTTGGASS